MLLTLPQGMKQDWELIVKSKINWPSSGLLFESLSEFGRLRFEGQSRNLLTEIGFHTQARGHQQSQAGENDESCRVCARAQPRQADLVDTIATASVPAEQHCNLLTSDCPHPHLAQFFWGTWHAMHLMQYNPKAPGKERCKQRAVQVV